MSNNSLYGTSTTTGEVASSNFTTLYSGAANAVPVAVVGNTTYEISSSGVSGGANLLLTGSDGSVDSVKYQSGTGITVSSLDNSTILITNTSAAGTTYTQNASATTGGANLNLVGSDSTIDAVKFASGTGITVSRTDADTITITNTSPAGTTYTINASATTGGANLNLVGSDATTDSIKFAGGTNVTVTRTDADTITISTVADNIPDGTANGQVLVWENSAWTASNEIVADTSSGRLAVIYKNSSAGVNNIIYARKDYGAGTYTTGDGSGLAFQLKSNTQTANSLAVINATWDPTAPIISLATNINQNTGGPFVTVANFTSALTTLPGNLTMAGETLKINSDSTAADSYLYLKGTSVYVKYNNATDYIEMPRTAIDNIIIDNNTISTTTGNLILDSASTAVNVDNDLYIGGIAEVGGEYLKINADSTAANSFLYMKGTSKYLEWNNTDQVFVFNDTLFGNVDIIAGSNLATNGNNIWFNYDDVSAADSYLTVRRGTSADVSIRWNQSSSKWQFTNDGTTYYDIPVNIDDLADVVITPPVASGQFLVNDGTNWINSSEVNFTSTTYRPLFEGKVGVNGRVSTSLLLNNNTGAVNYGQGDGSGFLVGVDSDAQATSVFASVTAAYDLTGNHQFRVNTTTTNFAADTATSITGGNTLVFSTAHGWSAGDRYLYLTTTQNGLVQNTYYYVLATGLTTTQAQVSLTLGGSAVALTNGTGLTLTFQDATRLFSADQTAFNITSPNLTLNAIGYGTGQVDTQITVERGTSGSDAYIKWDTTNDLWNFSNTIYANGAIIAGADLATNGNNIIFNNDDGAAADSYLTVKRGASPDVSIRWNESTNRWQDTTDGTNYLNLPNQNLDTTDSVAFSNIAIDSQATLDTSTLTTTSTATVALNATARNAMTGLINIVQGTDVHCLNYTALRTGATTAMLTTYAEMYNTSSLASFTADVSGGNLRLLVTPASATSTVFSVVRTSLT